MSKFSKEELAEISKLAFVEKAKNDAVKGNYDPPGMSGGAYLVAGLLTGGLGWLSDTKSDEREAYNQIYNAFKN